MRYPCQEHLLLYEDYFLKAIPYLKNSMGYNSPGIAECLDGEIAEEFEAKKAAIHPATTRSYNHRPLKSARIGTIKEAAKKQWDKEWKEGKSNAR
jgi:hypothetical protein